MDLLVKFTSSTSIYPAKNSLHLKGRNGEFSGDLLKFFSKAAFEEAHLFLPQQAPRADLCRRVWIFGQEQHPLYSVYWILLESLVIATRNMAGLWVLAKQDLSGTQTLPSWVCTGGSFPVCHCDLTLRNISVCCPQFHWASFLLPQVQLLKLWSFFSPSHTRFLLRFFVQFFFFLIWFWGVVF